MCVCVYTLSEASHQERFERWLSEINSSDGICLLTTFAHMAQPKRTDADSEFVKTIVLEIYEVTQGLAPLDKQNFSSHCSDHSIHE